MTDPTGAQSGSEDASAQSGTTGEVETAGDASTGTDGNSSAQSGAQVAETVTRAEFDRLRTQLAAADRNREAAQQELRQLRDKDLPELDKLKRDLEETQAENERLKTSLHDQAIDNAFFSNTKHSWHDPKAARRLLNLEGVTVGDDRTVVGMESAAAKLAKENPWLLKSEETASATTTGPGAGTPPMNGRAGTTDPKTAAAATLQRFPAMRTRHQK